MEKLTRRAAIQAAPAGAAAAMLASSAAAAADDAKLWTLEGELKVHPKFIYRYYIELLGGLKCALYGADHGRDPAPLARIQLPDFVRVRGALGTERHLGGTQENPSPFPPGWTLYMDVHEVEALKYDLGERPQPAPKR